MAHHHPLPLASTEAITLVDGCAVAGELINQCGIQRVRWVDVDDTTHGDTLTPVLVTKVGGYIMRYSEIDVRQGELKIKS
jgi:hypothetical protein